MATPQPKDAAAAILERYDTNKDKKLSKEEIERIIVEYEKTREAIPPDVLAALRTYDEDGDGKLDAKVRTFYVLLCGALAVISSSSRSFANQVRR